ncbi:MAG: Rieske 2Fe-2S domain-containing protein [Chloroflexi bacterium]|nr:Rieske 2Fe-2S domain-containing protein [Chloroflexota bacterium]
MQTDPARIGTFRVDTEPTVAHISDNAWEELFMLTQEENDFLTRVGPGTPAGELLRRYWHPVATHKDLTEESPTKFVRVLGEDLVLFKDKSGRVGLVADKCPHRSASLVYGRVEERGISCAYHGWLYDCEGNILETPPERNDAVMKNIKIKSYPVQTFVGLHWAYLGPAPAPVIPHYDIWMRKDGTHSVQVRPVLDANWLQPMENSADSPHLEILHQMSIGGGRLRSTRRAGSSTMSRPTSTTWNRGAA